MQIPRMRKPESDFGAASICSDITWTRYRTKDEIPFTSRDSLLRRDSTAVLSVDAEQIPRKTTSRPIKALVGLAR